MFKLPVRRIALIAALATIPALFIACGGGGSTDATATSQILSAEASLGARIFNDKNLSASREQSCASCHVDTAGFAQNNGLSAQFGGPLGNLQGGRSSPSAAYLHTNVAFNIDADGTPNGGFFWDGRADSLAEQAAGPFLNPVEMAMPDKASVIDRIKVSSYAADFKAKYGATIFDTANVDLAYQRMTEAIAKFETESSTFHAFSSKYDAFLRDQTTLSAQEQRGLALFNDPLKGNCAACHPSDIADNGDHPLFTDFTYDNLGVPRNPLLSANADAAHFDLGLCTRKGADPAVNPDRCGAFKVPSLRNVALRKAYFHNGAFTSLKDVVTFYVQRDTNPEKWYPTLPGSGVAKFNDLPVQYQANVNTSEAPYNRILGEAPALSDTEIDDVVAFLGTLSDGYTGR
jgi:cytochrome c peroxidase